MGGEGIKRLHEDADLLETLDSIDQKKEKNDGAKIYS